MTVNVGNKNGIRYGNFSIHGIKGAFPNQAIISTNLNHVKIAEQQDFDFKTKILEIVSFFPSRIRNEPEYREKKIKEFSKIITSNSDKLCMLTIRGVRGDFKMTKDTNEFFIKFQIACGFKLIRAYFTYARDALENSQQYRSMIPNECSFVALIDENLTHHVFKQLYLDCLKKQDEIVCFFGTKTNWPKKQEPKKQTKLSVYLTKRKRQNN